MKETSTTTSEKGTWASTLIYSLSTQKARKVISMKYVALFFGRTFCKIGSADSRLWLACSLRDAILNILLWKERRIPNMPQHFGSTCARMASPLPCMYNVTCGMHPVCIHDTNILGSNSTYATEGSSCSMWMRHIFCILQGTYTRQRLILLYMWNLAMCGAYLLVWIGPRPHWFQWGMTSKQTGFFFAWWVFAALRFQTMPSKAL